MTIAVFRRLALLAACALVVAGVSVVVPGAVRGGLAFAPLGHVVAGGAHARVRPSRASAVHVDLAAVRASLARGGAVALPAPDGGVRRFEVRRTETLAPALAAAHPEIATYAGRGLDDPGTSVALDVTPMGLHAAVRGAPGRGTWYVDPAYERRGTTTHLSYYGSDVASGAKGVTDTAGLETTARAAAGLGASGALASYAATPGGSVTTRTYRIALTNDPTYAQTVGTANVLAEKATLVSRLNQLYGADLAIGFQLIDETPQLNLDTFEKAYGANGPCGAHPCFDDQSECGPAAAQRNVTVLGQLVGAGAYDLGHLLLGHGTGGWANPAGRVGDDFKGSGCSALPQPTGDPFAIDVVAHEMGHQFFAHHTFNGTAGWCGSAGARNAGTAVEPGSGSSVMGYAGWCGADDLQAHSDPYFSHRSIAEIEARLATTNPRRQEVQTVSLRGFGPGAAITLGYQGQTATLTEGTDYNAAGIKAALDKMTGVSTTVKGWGDDTLSNVAPVVDDTGFQVTFAGPLAADGTQQPPVDMAPITVASDSAGVTGWSGETVRGGPQNRGGATATSTNHAPTVLAPADRTIPVRTPFTLTAQGSDPDGDPLTYVWEQNDPGTTGAPVSAQPKLDGPLFRTFGGPPAADAHNVASGDPSRTFPDLDQILAGNTDATADCPQVPRPADCFAEYLPTAAYVGASAPAALDLGVTARDGNAVAGGTAYDEVRLTLAPTAGPFLVGPHGDATGGTTTDVTWSPNGTQAFAPLVRISLSLDGGHTFKTELAATTANDGSESVALPDVATTHARLKVEAVDNYFFDISDQDFAVVRGADPVPTDTVAPSPTVTDSPSPTVTDSPSPTVTDSPSPTVTDSPSPTVTDSPSPTVTEQPSTTPTVTDSPTPSPDTDTTPPETTLETVQPREGTVFPARTVAMRFHADEAAGAFSCTLDGAPTDCGPDLPLLSSLATGSALLRQLRPGAHTFTVAATDLAGNVDPTPAARHWVTPYDDRDMRHVGRWDPRVHAAAYAGTFRQANRTGVALTRWVDRAQRVSLVVGRGPRYGTVRVLAGPRTIGRVSLASRTVGFRRVVPLARLDRAYTGRVRVVALSARTVRIDGLGVVPAPPSTA